MDARHPLTELDRQMFGWFLPTGRPMHVLLTKCDKLGTEAQRRTLDNGTHRVERELWHARARIGVQLFSATRHIGIAEAEAALASWLGPLAN